MDTYKHKHKYKCIKALIVCSSIWLTGCDLPFGDKKPDPEAEGRAIGSACRHAMRGIEDCYAKNPDALKSAVFNGWKDMDAYMRENKLEGQQPAPPPPPPPVKKESDEDAEEKKPAKAKAKEH